MERPDLTVVALGGNALIPAGRAGSIAEQQNLTRATMRQLAPRIAAGMPVVLTHGNGPIVGNIALRNEALANTIPPMPLDVCGAESQGGIGYMVQQILGNEFARLQVWQPVVTVVTQVQVDPHDPAFETPTKPIGPFYDADEAQRLQNEKGWTVVEDAGRGYRRIVASPQPHRIVEIDIIRKLVDSGIVVNCVGGGGAPVVQDGHELVGIEAVVDKDHSAAILALQLGAGRLVILTGVEAVMRGFGTAAAEPLRQVTVEDVEELLAAGEFAPGSMQPKIRAAVDFIHGGGYDVVITDPEHLSAALDGDSGTRITVGDPSDVHEV